MQEQRTATTDPKVFLLILNWNGWEDTLDCLESAFRTSYPNLQIVVIDNCSENDSLAMIREWAEGKRPARKRFGQEEPAAKPIAITFYDKATAEQGGKLESGGSPKRPDGRGLVVIQTGANLGFAGGNNVGIRYALARGADYVLLLNNDAFFRSPETVSAMVSFMEQTPRCGASGGRMLFPDGTPQQSFGNFPTVPRMLASLFPAYKLLPRTWLRRMKRSCVVPDGSLSRPTRIDWPSGACLMARRPVIEEVGLLDERFFLYLEETDWCYRMRAKGWDRYYLPDVEVVHVFGGTVSGTPISMKRHHLDSQFAYFRKHLPAAALTVMAAGYFVRSLPAWLFWQAREAVVPPEQRADARRKNEYWRSAFYKSLAVLRDLASGKTRSRSAEGAFPE